MSTLEVRLPHLETQEVTELFFSSEFCGNVAQVLGHTVAREKESGFVVCKGTYGLQVSEPLLQDEFVFIAGRELDMGLLDRDDHLEKTFYMSLLFERRYNPVPGEGKKQNGSRRDVVLAFHSHPTHGQWYDLSVEQSLAPSRRDIDSWRKEDQKIPYAISAIGASRDGLAKTFMWRRNSGRATQNKNYKYNSHRARQTVSYAQILGRQGLNCVVMDFDLLAQEFVTDPEESAVILTA